MKSILKSIVLVISITLAMTPQQTKAQQVSVGFQVFYDDLSPYGTWVNSPDYGYVWLPSVEAGFTPYGSNGYWAMTEYGWTWVSTYSWGWAPFHYGRWYSDPMYGPMWVPGNEWGPGWVTWRQSEGYYGWAPIAPGISIEVANSANYNPPHDAWSFVSNRDFGREDIHNHLVDRSTNITIIHNSTVINNTYVDKQHGAKFNSGPQRAEAEKHANKTFAPIAIKESNKPGQVMGKGELQLYRPLVQKNNSPAKKEAPVKVADRKDLKPQPQPKQQPVQNKPTQPEKKQPAQTKQQPTVREHAKDQTPVQPNKQQPNQPVKKAEQKQQQPSAPDKNKQPNREQPLKQQQQRTEPPHQQGPVNPEQPKRELPPQPKPNINKQPQEQPRQETAPPQRRTEPPRENQNRNQQKPQQKPNVNPHHQEQPPQPQLPQQQQNQPQPKLQGEGRNPH